MTCNREENLSNHKILANYASQFLFVHLTANIGSVFVLLTRMSLKWQWLLWKKSKSSWNQKLWRVQRNWKITKNWWKRLLRNSRDQRWGFPLSTQVGILLGNKSTCFTELSSSRTASWMTYTSSQKSTEQWLVWNEITTSEKIEGWLWRVCLWFWLVLFVGVGGVLPLFWLWFFFFLIKVGLQSLLLCPQWELFIWETRCRTLESILYNTCLLVCKRRQYFGSSQTYLDLEHMVHSVSAIVFYFWTWWLPLLVCWMQSSPS